jgi:hypothetical protein
MLLPPHLREWVAQDDMLHFVIEAVEGMRLSTLKMNQRATGSEPVFGIIKEVLGFTRFLLRGLAKAEGQWSLVCLAYNVKRLWQLQAA